MKFLKKLWAFMVEMAKSEEGKAPVEPVIVPPIKPIPEIPIEGDDVLTALVVNESSKTELKSVCNIIKINWNEYKFVEEKTGVPADVVASCHYRESSLDFRGVLHNGEFIIGTGKKTKLVPAGRGPFLTWSEAAVDAMMIEKAKFPKQWDTFGKLDFCEKFNGLGYRKKGVVSPYVYAGTNKYKSGLYVADGKYDSSKIDKRLGCAAIIKGLRIS